MIRQKTSALTGCPTELPVEFTSKITMDWEGEEVVEHFHKADTVLSVPASIVDCITFFESGVVAYSLALMFGEQGKSCDLNAQQLLAIGARVNSAGQFKDGKVEFVVGANGGQSDRFTLRTLLRNRLRTFAGAEICLATGS